MVNRRYRRDFGDRSYYGGFITKDQFDMGTARDGFPGMQQAIHNEIVEFDGHLNGLLSGFELSYSAGTVTISSGAAIISGSLTDIAGGSITGVSDGDYIYYGTSDGLYHAASSIDEVSGFLLGRIVSGAADEEYRVGIRESPLIDGKYGRIGYPKEFLHDVMIHKTVNMMGVPYERVDDRDIYRAGNIYYVKDLAGLSYVLGVSGNRTIVINGDISFSGSAIDISAGDVTIYGNGVQIGGKTLINLYSGSKATFVDTIFESGMTAYVNEPYSELDAINCKFNDYLQWDFLSGAEEAIPASPDVSERRHVLKVYNSYINGFIFRGGNTPDYIIGPLIDFTYCKIDRKLDTAYHVYSIGVYNPHFSFRNCYITVNQTSSYYPFMDFLRLTNTGASKFEIIDSYICVKTRYTALRTEAYNVTIEGNTFIFDSGAESGTAIMVKDSDKCIFTENELHGIIASGNVDIVNNNMVIIKNNIRNNALILHSGNTTELYSDNLPS